MKKRTMIHPLNLIDLEDARRIEPGEKRNMNKNCATERSTTAGTVMKTAGRRLRYLAAGIALGAATVNGAAVADDDDDRTQAAEAEIFGCAGSGIFGKATLVEEDSEEGIKVVRISIKVEGLEQGKHGVHIHETAECEPCGAAGGHFDPGPFGMTNPDANHPFHSGDLVNIEAHGDNGTGKLKVETTRVTLSPGPLSIFDEDGSAFIVHVNEDTYCPDGAESGCAGGGRVACGIIVPKD